MGDSHMTIAKKTLRSESATIGIQNSEDKLIDQGARPPAKTAGTRSINMALACKRRTRGLIRLLRRQTSDNCFDDNLQR